jgi:hypothetical protein
MCLVQKREREGRGEIRSCLVYKLRGGYIKINLPFYRYKHQRVSQFYKIGYKIKLYPAGGGCHTT